MKIRIEIDTTDPSPDIAALVSEVVKAAVAARTHDDDTPLDPDVSVDDKLLTLLEDTQARINLVMTHVTRGKMIYKADEPGPEHSLTFELETGDSEPTEPE